MRKFWMLSVVLTALLVSACISVPQEVVQLSTLTTTDIKALHDGYRSLVRKHYVALRKVREQEFADKVLGPYVEQAIKEGRLLEVVQGNVVWQASSESFVAPDPAKATMQKLDTLNTWNRQVASDIEELRKDAFSDLDTSETKLLDQVDAAFGNVLRGNTTIHAYLLSIQKVQNAQNEFLKGIGLGDLSKQLKDSLEKASEDAAKWTAKTDDANKKVDSLKNQVNKIRGK